MRARIHLRRWVDWYEHRQKIYAMLGIRVTKKRILTERYTIKFIKRYYYCNWFLTYTKNNFRYCLPFYTLTRKLIGKYNILNKFLIHDGLYW